MVPSRFMQGVTNKPVTAAHGIGDESDHSQHSTLTEPQRGRQPGHSAHCSNFQLCPVPAPLVSVHADRLCLDPQLARSPRADEAPSDRALLHRRSRRSKQLPSRTCTRSNLAFSRLPALQPLPTLLPQAPLLSALLLTPVHSGWRIWQTRTIWLSIPSGARSLAAGQLAAPPP